MRIRRIFASDMRQAMRQMKEELGPDAVILSSTRQPDGVEVVAAVDVADGDTVPTGPEAESPPAEPAPAAPAAPTMATESDEDGGALTYQRPRRAPQRAATTPPPRQEPPTEAPPASFDAAVEEASAGLGPLLEQAEAGAEETPPPSPKAARQTMDWEDDAEDEPVPPRLELDPELGRRAEPAPAVSDSRILAAVREELDGLQDLLHQLNEVGGMDPGPRPTNPANSAGANANSGASASASAPLGGAERLAELDLAGEALRRTLDEAILPPRRDIMAQGGVVALVGPTGVGKTTTVAKLAARYALRHGYDQVALVTTDSYRIAAHEQLRTYARILGIPVRVANDENELRTTLDNLADRSLVLIDTAGMSQRDRRLAEQFHTLVAGAPSVQTYAVLAANTQAGSLAEVVRAFQGAELDGCILTKLDECTSLGGVLGTIMEHRLPLAFFSDGQRVPEDIYPASPERIAERMEALAAAPEETAPATAGEGGAH